MTVRLLTLIAVFGLTVFVSQSASAAYHKPPKHHPARVISGSRNNLPPGFGSASGSSGEGITDNAPPPDEPADDGDGGDTAAPPRQVRSRLRPKRQRPQ